jgi:hypothetical protein
VAILGAVCALMGGLWLVQGLGLVRIEPLLCFANCETVDAPSTTWTVAGLIALAAGVLAMIDAIRRPRRT